MSGKIRKVPMGECRFTTSSFDHRRKRELASPNQHPDVHTVEEPSISTNPPFGKKISVTITNEEGEVSKESLVIIGELRRSAKPSFALNMDRHKAAKKFALVDK